MIDAPTERLTNCPLCGETSWQTLTVPGRWIGSDVFEDLQGKIGLVRCCHCKLVFTHPRPSAARLSTFYAGDSYRCHEPTGSVSVGSRADFILNWIARCLPADIPRTLLDYGAGGGGFLCHARSRGWTVRGFEPGKRGLQACRQAGLDMTDRLESLPRREFSVVTLHHVFEHLADPIAVLVQIRQLLAPDGRLFIEVPNVRSLRARLAHPLLSSRMAIDERHRAYPIHLMYYSDSTLRQMLAKGNWVVQAACTLGMGLDEFFVRAESPERQTLPSRATSTVVSPPKRRWRHRLRDAFLRLGLGENLAVVAYPAAPP
jgi:SAM-dependent methyltransferase